MSNCNPVGYWKNENKTICLSYDDAVDSGTVLVPRRCKGEIEQKWAIKGTFICHPVKDKCFTPIYIKEINKAMVALAAYGGTEDQQWKWNNDDVTQLVTMKSTCLEDADNIYLGSAFIKIAICDQNKNTQKWSFTPITDAHNRLECVNFSQRPSKRP